MEKMLRARYTLEYKLQALGLMDLACTTGSKLDAGVEWSPGQQACYCRTKGTGEAACAAGAREDEAGHRKKGGSVLRAKVGMKYVWIDRNRRHWPVSVLCEELAVSASG